MTYPHFNSLPSRERKYGYDIDTPLSEEEKLVKVLP